MMADGGHDVTWWSRKSLRLTTPEMGMESIYDRACKPFCTIGKETRALVASAIGYLEIVIEQVREWRLSLVYFAIIGFP